MPIRCRPVSGIHSKWPVLRDHTVEASDLDADGIVRDECVSRWVAAAVNEYVDQCPRVLELASGAGSKLTQTPVAVPPGAAMGQAASVLVSAGATEVHPTSFTVAVRIRPIGEDDHPPANATCVVRVDDVSTGEPRELGNAIRDELIALQHAARYFN